MPTRTIEGKGTLYIDGHAVGTVDVEEKWGIVGFGGNLEPIEPIEPTEPVRVPDPAETATLELEITKEQVDSAMRSLNQMFDELKQQVQMVGEQLTSNAKKISEGTRKAMELILDNLLYEANENPKWWHLYKNARKFRTRKKYRRKLMEQLHRKMKATSAT